MPPWPPIELPLCRCAISWLPPCMPWPPIPPWPCMGPMPPIPLFCIGPMPPLCIPIPPWPCIDIPDPPASASPSQDPLVASEASCPPCWVHPCCCSCSCLAASHTPVAERLLQFLHNQVPTLDPCLSSASPLTLASLAFPLTLAFPQVLHIGQALMGACPPLIDLGSSSAWQGFHHTLLRSLSRSGPHSQAPCSGHQDTWACSCFPFLAVHSAPFPCRDHIGAWVHHTDQDHLDP